MHALDEGEAKKLLMEYGIPTTKFVVVENDDELDKIGLRFPLVMKVCSPRITHKTDVGGVVLNIANHKQLKENFLEMKRKFKDEKILIEEMEKNGIEMIVGSIKDEFFDRVIMVGMGGIYTELYKDVSFRKIPISKKDAENMLKELKAYKIFEGFRGMKADKEAMLDLILKISDFVVRERVHQMDLNPVFVYEKGAKVIDAKVVIE
ncbi:MAG: acetate--CoA ligase family protein [Thermoplasmata archaeon]|nr:acetate--CoA ligase family protein [Thermoplasmata archaeon]